jgi:hypothetical protein
MSIRKIYQAVIIPQALWGISAWYCPAAGSMPAWEMAKLVNELKKLQKRAAILISGALKSISTAALDIELLPKMPTGSLCPESVLTCLGIRYGRSDRQPQPIVSRFLQLPDQIRNMHPT